MPLNTADQRTPREMLIPLTKSAPKRVTLTPNVPQLILSPNPDRAFVEIVNKDLDEVTLHFGEGNVAVGVGIPLMTRGSNYEIDSKNLWLGKVTAISLKGSELSITEFSY